MKDQHPELSRIGAMLDLVEAENIANPSQERTDALGRVHLLIAELRIRLEAALDAEKV
jgi:hypothetical protein